MSTPANVNLGFINKDVEAQFARSRDAVEVAESLNSLLPQIENPEVRAQVEQNIRRLLGIADSLTKNATFTSNNAALTIVSSRGGNG